MRIVKVENVADVIDEIVEFERSVARLQSTDDTASQHNLVHEVVEMTGLQCCVLTIVRKAQEFAEVVRLISISGHLVELLQDLKRQDGRCRASSFAGQTNESVFVSSSRSVGVQTIDADLELAGQYPKFFPFGSAVALNRKAKPLWYIFFP